LTPDPFASAQLGLSVFRLARPGDARAALESVADHPGPFMVEVKVPVEQVENVSALTALGFWLVDTGVQFGAPAATLAANAAVRSEAWRIREARPEDRPRVARVVSDNMVTSRYHLDPRIDAARATEFKRAWVENFFDGLRGQRLLLAEDDSGIRGFLLVLEAGARGVIDLIGVDPSLRGTGAVGGLISAWLAQAPHIAHVVVGTQVSNVTSMRAYGKLGFRVCGASYVLHYVRLAAHSQGAA